MGKKRLVRTGLYIAAVSGILDTIIIRSRSGSMDFGIILPGLGGLALLLGLLFSNSSIYKNRKKLFNNIFKAGMVLFTLWLVSFVIVSVILISSAISERTEKVDCVIVLGAGLKGETPTLVLAQRLDNTLAYAAENPGTVIIVSGGQGRGEAITEAEGMKRYLVRHGIDEDLIIKEEKSTSTFENMVFSRNLYKQSFGKELRRVMLITNDFHMFRSKMLAKRAGLEPCGISSGTPWYIYPNVFLREYLAVFKSLIFDR
ncbi:hypothetical protein CLHUN_20850 [Ruminiclostridium hungatei]|uniref:DUF218 domain-containing protein n=1 Tax=Ruminiclostridium hungatei TaxID=48256 RepID=A0A1V4SJM0_RUMHU|nr:YdcF family protein [Ruminiclostridium hungatei]OPX44060.1 hypothetical protein CLHUN_20850 [Ruminiclostridium hungatei]